MPHVEKYFETLKAIPPHYPSVMELTEAQDHVLTALDDAAEHMSWEFEPEDYQGISTIGFAHIGNIDGRSSFVKRVKSLAKSGKSPNVVVDERLSGDSYRIDIGNLEATLRKDHTGGYRLNISSTTKFIDGPEMQRMDVRERLHNLLLSRLQYDWGYLDDAYVKSRMD